MVNLVVVPSVVMYQGKSCTTEQRRKGRIIQCNNSTRNDPRKFILKKNRVCTFDFFQVLRLL